MMETKQTSNVWLIDDAKWKIKEKDSATFFFFNYMIDTGDWIVYTNMGKNK